MRLGELLGIHRRQTPVLPEREALKSSQFFLCTSYDGTKMIRQEEVIIVHNEDYGSVTVKITAGCSAWIMIKDCHQRESNKPHLINDEWRPEAIKVEDRFPSLIRHGLDENLESGQSDGSLPLLIHRGKTVVGLDNARRTLFFA